MGTQIYSVLLNRCVCNCKVKDIKLLLCKPTTFSAYRSKSYQPANQYCSFVPKTHTQPKSTSQHQRTCVFPNKAFHCRAIFTLPMANASHQRYKLSQRKKMLDFHPTTLVHSGTDELSEEQPPSWLFVSAAVAGVYGAQVNLELDLEERLKEETVQIMRENIKSRGLSVDVDSLVQNFKLMKQMQQERDILMSQKKDILQQFKALKEEGSEKSHEDTKKHLVNKLSFIKGKIADLKSSWDIEEKVMLGALDLPNDVHPTTPLDELVVLREANLQEESLHSLNHVEIAKKFDLIKFSNVGPKAYYLKKDLVLAEMTLTSLVCDFLRSNGFRHMSGPEFVKTPIVEGCGGDVRDVYEVLTMVDPHKTAIEPMNHLSGVSLYMFAAYVARTCIGDSVLPLQMFACGRRYQNSDLPGLFGATQSTQASLFSCVKETDLERQFDNILELIWKFLLKFGFALRLRQTCVKDLRREEMRRVDFEIFSPSLEQFIPVASVSDVGDFVSRRLMVTHNQNHADIRTAKRLHMIHGTVLNITSFLALWMEHSFSDETQFTLKKLPPLQPDTDISIS